MYEQRQGQGAFDRGIGAQVPSRFKTLLGAFAKLQKVTISLVMSVRPHGTTRLVLDTFSLNFILENF